MKKLFTLLLLLLSMITTKAQVAGDWKGELEAQGTKMEMIFHISEKDGNLSATLDIPAQGASGLAMTTAKFENNKLNLAMEQAGFSYEGELKGESIEGKFKQAGMEFPLLLKKTKITKPGDPSLVSSEAELAKLIALGNGNYKYKVEDYFAKPKSSSFALSPNGKYISYREKDEKNKRHVMIKEVATGKVVRAI